MPERVIESSYHLEDGRIVQHLFGRNVIPAVGIETLGNPEEYHIEGRAEIGLQVLREAFALAEAKWPIAMEMGYTLRDEGRSEEALTAFAQAAEAEPNFAPNLLGTNSPLS
jgi:tetratricopeptide (TPR) repeat protein